MSVGKNTIRVSGREDRCLRDGDRFLITEAAAELRPAIIPKHEPFQLRHGARLSGWRGIGRHDERLFRLNHPGRWHDAYRFSSEREATRAQHAARIAFAARTAYDEIPNLAGRKPDRIGLLTIIAVEFYALGHGPTHFHIAAMSENNFAAALMCAAQGCHRVPPQALTSQHAHAALRIASFSRWR